MIDFPVLKFSRTNGLWKQIGHMESEMREVADAFYKPSPYRIAEEIADVMVSSMTALRILQRDYGIVPEEVLTEVFVKNKARGYEEEKKEIDYVNA